MNSKHAFLALSLFTLVSIAHGEREVFAPTKLAPVATAANGNITFSNTNPFWTGANISSTTNFGIGPTTANLLSFHSNGAERMRISSTGNVFVGNGETVASVANGNIRATGGSGTNINGADLVLHGGQSTGTASGGALRFFTAPAGGVSGTSVNASTERMRIDSAGNVGIGTNNPAYKLDVVSPAGTGTSVRIDGDASVGSTALRLADRGTERLAVFASTSNAFVNANANANSLILWAQKAGGSILGVTGTSQTERFRITDGADVVFGNGDTSATPANATIRGTNASGTDIGGPNLTIQAGRGTGSASGGSILLQTAPTGTTGSTLNAAVTRMVVHTNGTVFVGPSSVSATPTTGNISSAGGSGTNIAGSGLDIRAGAGTGTGAGGSINLYTASPGGVSGSGLNSQTARVTLKPGGQLRFVPLAAAPTVSVEDGDVYYNSTTNKLQVRAAGVWVDLH